MYLTSILLHFNLLTVSLTILPRLIKNLSTILKCSDRKSMQIPILPLSFYFIARIHLKNSPSFRPIILQSSVIGSLTIVEFPFVFFRSKKLILNFQIFHFFLECFKSQIFHTVFLNFLHHLLMRLRLFFLILLEVLNIKMPFEIRHFLDFLDFVLEPWQQNHFILQICQVQPCEQLRMFLPDLFGDGNVKELSVGVQADFIEVGTRLLCFELIDGDTCEPVPPPPLLFLFHDLRLPSIEKFVVLLFFPAFDDEVDSVPDFPYKFRRPIELVILKALVQFVFEAGLRVKQNEGGDEDFGVFEVQLFDFLLDLLIADGQYVPEDIANRERVLPVALVHDLLEHVPRLQVQGRVLEVFLARQRLLQS